MFLNTIIIILLFSPAQIFFTEIFCHYYDYGDIEGNVYQPLTCEPMLQSPINGRIRDPCNNQIGQVCNFECFPGFNIVGPASVVCSSDGKWTSAEPVCVKEQVTTPPSCPLLLTPANGFHFGSCGPNAKVGSTCTFACKENYKLNGNAILFCLEGGIWNSDIPQCIVNPPVPPVPPVPSVPMCPKLNQPNFGAYRGECSPGIEGQICEFFCDSGYCLVGPRILFCSGGRWSSSIPYCQRCS